MPGIPKKALREKDLRIVKRVGDSSHETYQATFLEDGAITDGFFKKLEPEGPFPELLAKISVAVSVILEFICGRAAKERLVFDDNDKIVGIVSLGIKDFKSFNFNSEKPKDAAEEELVIPSTKTLITHNVMELLVVQWLGAHDDAHPHNMSLKYLIDFDMYFYWFTVHMKGGRLGVELPKDRVDLTVRDYERFPCVVDAKPYHWATFTHPGQGSIVVLPDAVQAQLPLPKVFADPMKFEALAADPQAQDQKVAAVLKALLTFQPDLLRKRLTDAFDKLPLNYTCLLPDVQRKYTEKFPQLCNKITNKEPFVDFIMNVYQQHYDNLYRVVVFYMGTQNNGFRVSLLPTYEALYRKPSLYQDVVAWVSKHNESCEPEHKYDLDALKTRYHQIWRDANTSTLKELLKDARDLTREIGKLATNDGIVEVVVTKETTDNSVTSSMQLFGAMKDISINSEILVPEDSPLRKACMALPAFTNEFQRLVKTYYDKERTALTDADNFNFALGLEALCSEYELVIREHLKHKTSHAEHFVSVVMGMKRCAEQINFRRHLLSTDAQMSKVEPVAKKDLLPLTDPITLEQFNETLFQWVESLSSDTFNKYIDEIIEKKYIPSLSRIRGPAVREYLAKSMESNPNKLAYILCSGNEDGALNRCIIQGLAPIMLQTNYIPSVTLAIRDGRFDEHAGAFVKEAVHHAKAGDGLVHLYSHSGVNLFFKTLYQWMDTVDANRLTPLVSGALHAYENGLSSVRGLLNFGFMSSVSASRTAKIKAYFQKNIPAKALALTFMEGELTSTASEQVLLAIVRAIKSDIKAKPELKKHVGYALMDLFNENENKEFYKTQIKCGVTAALLRPEAAAAAAAAAM